MVGCPRDVGMVTGDFSERGRSATSFVVGFLRDDRVQPHTFAAALASGRNFKAS